MQKPIARNSDAFLLWYVWEDELKKNEMLTITKYEFCNVTSAETITRTRRKIQKLYPTLRADKKVQEYRKKIEETKGLFIYN